MASTNALIAFNHSFIKEKKLESHESMGINHDHCHVEIPGSHNKILKCNQDQKSMNIPFIICAGTES